LTEQPGGLILFHAQQVLIRILVTITLKRAGHAGDAQVTFHRDLPQRREPLEIVVNVLAASLIDCE
jgi:hypothetical protein